MSLFSRAKGLVVLPNQYAHSHQFDDVRIKDFRGFARKNTSRENTYCEQFVTRKKVKKNFGETYSWQLDFFPNE